MNKQNSTPLEQDSISLKTAGLACLVIGIVIAFVIGAFALLDQMRQRQVVANYTKIAHQFIVDNHGQVEQIFAQTFPMCAEQYITQKNTTSYYMASSICSPAKTQFDALNKGAIKDFSSVAFMKVTDHKVEVLRASADYYPLHEADYNNFRNKEELENYLFHHEHIRMWDTFLTYMSQRQVLVPVEQNGQVIGYLFIGVIEK